MPEDSYDVKARLKSFGLEFGLRGTKSGRDTRRTFNKTQQDKIVAVQKNKCAGCGEILDRRATRFHHKKAWAEKGRTTVENGVALCSKCHDIVTSEERLKKVDKKRPKRQSADPFKIKTPKFGL
jgi:5-methylcytosine-specific restriction endonuclease McrA